jgi:hypothetical protein
MKDLQSIKNGTHDLILFLTVNKIRKLKLTSRF